MKKDVAQRETYVIAFRFTAECLHSQEMHSLEHTMHSLEHTEKMLLSVVNVQDGTNPIASGFRAEAVLLLLLDPLSQER